MAGCFKYLCSRGCGGGNPHSFRFTAPFNDPFALTHLSDFHNAPPIASTYRTKSGGTTGVKVDADDMRRIDVHDDDCVLVMVQTAQRWPLFWYA